MSHLNKSQKEHTLVFDTLRLNAERPFIHLLIIFGFCFFLSALFLSLGTKSSPLYPFNDWVDANAAFTMGKAMMNGKIIYRDIFDHRGPLYYLVYGLAYLISNTTFLGVFILEVISFSIFLFFCFKLVRLFFDESYALIVLILMSGAVVNLRSFAHGGSTEEFCLPFVAISLFYLIKYFKEISPAPMPHQWVFFNGVLAGCVLWMKLSLLGFWIGWIGSVLLIMLIRKQGIKAIKSGIYYLLGIFTATIPWILYFGINHSIYDWLNTYLFLNITSFTATSSLFNRIKFILTHFIVHLIFNPLSVGLMGVGLYAFIKNRKYLGDLVNRLSLLCCVFFLYLSVFSGGRAYVYYFLIFAPFIIFGFIILFTHHFEEFGNIKSGKYFINIILISLIAIFSYTYQANQNTYMLSLDQEDFVQYKFATVIAELDDPTLLNYGTLDLGFYTTTGIIPNIKYFHKPLFSYEKYPVIMDEQQRYIKESVVDYIVMSIPVSIVDENIDIPYLHDNYGLIEKQKQEFEDIDLYFLLYKKNE